MAPPATTDASAVDASIKVYADCKTTSIEPSEIILACADLGSRFDHLTWTSWSSSSARATGDFVYNDCTPDCARGQSHSLATTVTLTSPVRDPNGQMVWSLVQSSPKPPGYDPEPDELPTQPT